ncbi:MAG: hypothetical protein K8L99_06150 [Anaerolineae bacterium]|nr:hypothetical protein [Anaerolineae bacterium]
MTKRLTILILSILFIFAVASIAAAQSIPTLDVSLEPTQAQANDIVYANVVVHNGVNIAGADVELTTSDPCLRFEGLEPGNYLPTGGETGYTVHKSSSDNSARLAANVLGRENVSNGDGIFFRVPMRVLCEQDSVSVNITQAHLVDDQLQEFKLSDGALNVTNAILAIGDTTGDQTVVQGDDTQSVVEAPAEQVSSNSIDIKMIVLVVGGLLGLVLAFVLMTQFRRFRQEEV